MKKSFAVAALAALIALGGCLSDKTPPDDKLANACLAAAKAVYNNERDVFELRKKSFRDEADSVAGTLRMATILTRYIHGGGAIQEKTFTCGFVNEGNAVRPWYKFHNMAEEGGRRFGNFNGVVEGDFSTMVNISSMTEAALD